MQRKAIYAEARATPARIQFTKFPEAAVVNLAPRPRAIDTQQNRPDDSFRLAETR